MYHVHAYNEYVCTAVYVCTQKSTNICIQSWYIYILSLLLSLLFMNCMCDFALFTIFNISPLSPANTSASHLSSTIQWSFTGICFDRVGNMRLPFSSPPNSYTYIISHTLIQIYHIYINVYVCGHMDMQIFCSSYCYYCHCCNNRRRHTSAHCQ